MTPTARKSVKPSRLGHRLLATFFGLALAGGLTTACSSDKTDNSGTVERDGGPVTVSSEYSEITLDSIPQRVVALGNASLEALSVLGIEPQFAIMDNEYKVPEPYTEEFVDKDYTDTQTHLWEPAPVLELVAKEEPDLIIAPANHSNQDDEFRGNLNKIAKTFFFDAQANRKSWKDGFRQVADIFDKNEEAQDYIDKYEEKVTSVRNTLSAEQGKTFTSVTNLISGNLQILAGYDKMLMDIGLVPGELQKETMRIKDAGGEAIQLSPERWGDIDTDYVIMGKTARDDENVINAAKEGHPLHGRIRFTETKEGVSLTVALVKGGALGSMWGIENISNIFNNPDARW